MIERTLKAVSAVLNHRETRRDSEFEVRRTSSISDVLEPDEEILWEGLPDPAQAWGDHDPMEPAATTGTKPDSRRARRVQMALLAGFILFMSLWGLVALVAGVEELVKVRSAGRVFEPILYMLSGLTLLSGLPFLLRPFANTRRARRLRYLITSRRTLIVRRGHAWSEIGVKSPVVFCVSLLFVYSVAFFAVNFGVSLHRDLLEGVPLGNLTARVVTGLLLAPVGLVFATLGVIGLRFQTEIVRDALRDRSALFVRSFPHEETERQDLPAVTRRCPDGVGDVILSVDHHWVSDDGPDPWLLATNGVGFLSVPDAGRVADRVREAMAQDASHRAREEERRVRVVKELMARDGKRKVEIYRRENGSFGFEAFRFSDDPEELSWIPDGPYSLCVTDTEETAESEARGRVDWLNDAGAR